MPSVYLRNQHPIAHLCPQFVVTSLSASPCFSKSNLIFSTYRHLPSNSSSKFPPYNRCNIYDETEFCSFWLLLSQNHFNNGPLSNFMYVVDQNFHYSETTISISLCKICGYLSSVFTSIHVQLLVCWSIISIAQFCTIILPNVHYLLSCTIIMLL